MSRAKGDIAEEKACEYLLSLGFLIVQRNFYSKFGEIDIIAKKADVLHFVEVKSGEDYESAVNNITAKKLRRVQRTAQTYLKSKAIDEAYMYDALIVTPEGVQLLENITF